MLVMPRAIAADLARAVIGPDHLAEPARLIIALRIVGRRVAIVARANMVAMMVVGASRQDVMPDNSRRGETIAAAAMERRAGTKAAAAEYGTAATETSAVNGCTTAAEAAAVKGCAATPEATAATATETTAAAMAAVAVAASDFSGQCVGSVFR